MIYHFSNFVHKDRDAKAYMAESQEIMPFISIETKTATKAQEQH